MPKYFSSSLWYYDKNAFIIHIFCLCLQTGIWLSLHYFKVFPVLLLVTIRLPTTLGNKFSSMISTHQLPFFLKWWNEAHCHSLDCTITIFCTTIFVSTLLLLLVLLLLLQCWDYPHASIFSYFLRIASLSSSFIYFLKTKTVKNSLFTSLIFFLSFTWRKRERKLWVKKSLSVIITFLGLSFCQARQSFTQIPDLNRCCEFLPCKCSLNMCFFPPVPWGSFW